MSQPKEAFVFPQLRLRPGKLWNKIESVAGGFQWCARCLFMARSGGSRQRKYEAAFWGMTDQNSV
jgi:hypothetical protein